MEPKCIQLMNLMIDSVYPRLYYLMLSIGKDEICVKMGEGFCDITYNVSGVIKKINPDGSVRTQSAPINELGKCPIFKTYTEPLDYIKYCNLIMDQIPVLEEIANKFDAPIERASKIGVVYERKILIEKTLTD